MMKTEKRKANVGERILVTNAGATQGRYANGDIGTVCHHCEASDDLVYVSEWFQPLFAKEYEVIIYDKPKKSARITALETQVAELQAKVDALEKAGQFPNTARFERESAEMDGILADIKRKARTPNEQRAYVIKRAKAFVAKHTKHNVTNGLGTTTGVRFGNGKGLVVIPELHVNKEKLAVTCLLKRVDNVVHRKAIAKCDPDDVFNADIGKAIALARALGVEVPTEFVKAVQPTEVVVGMRVFTNCSFGIMTVATDTRISAGKVAKSTARTLIGGKITDDTDAVYE